MDFSPTAVIEWYKKKSPLLKGLLLVVFIVAIILAAVWWFLGKSTGQDYPSKSESLEAITAALEAKSKREYEATKKQSAEFREKIEEEQTKRLRLQQEHEERMRRYEKEQQELDSVGPSADDVAALLNKQRERKRPG